jgi:hypothetical protein
MNYCITWKLLLIEVYGGVIKASRVKDFYDVIQFHGMWVSQNI